VSKESLNEINSLSDEALVFIEHYAISKTPEHYKIAYEYAKADNQNLVQILDKAISQNKTLNDKFLAMLHNKLYNPKDDNLIERVQKKLNSIIKEIFSQVDPFSKLSNLFEEKMLDAIDRIKKVTTPEALEEVVNKVVIDTQNMNNESSKLNKNLSSVTDELNNLKKDFAKVEKEALTDPLTKVLNRRGLEHKFEEEIKVCQNKKLPFSLLIIDVDRFKVFNDTFGHLVGDEVLRYIAIICKNNVKKLGTVSRFGGEEFVITLPSINHDKALKIAEKIRIAFDKTQLKRKEEPKDLGKLTVSIGISTFKVNDTLNTLLERADRALYKAKEGGRNRIESAQNR
jgi:diguanylate cyclase